MITSSNGCAFIEKWEGCKLTSYQDGGGVWTIGYGHTHTVTAGQSITQAQASQFLTDDLQPVELTINSNVKVTINQNQFDALASFAFNLGNSELTGSTLMKLLNRGDYSGAVDEFPKWCHDDGKVVQGLLDRRLAEQSLFLS